MTTSAGDPSLFTDRLHDAGITVFHVVGTLASAKKAVDAGVDGLVVEGVEGDGFKLASADSPVHGNLKQAVVRADETSTVLLPLDGQRMMRVIRTQAAENIDESASFEEGGAALQRVQRLYFDGDMDASVANTGQVAGRIEDIPPVADIIKQMWTGCREVLAATTDRLGPVRPSSDA